MISFLTSLWTWFAVAILILLWVPLLAVIRLFDRDPAYYRTGRWFRRVGVAMTKVNPAWTIDVDSGNIENPRNPYVMVCNHQSLADIPVVSLLPWEMKWVGKKELFDIPISGTLMRLAGDIAVDREDRRSGAQALIKAKEYLDKNCSVLFFPEGTRSKDGLVGRFNDGGFGLAIKAGVPVVPIALDGTVDALPKHSLKFGKADNIRVKVLEPVSTDGLDRKDARELQETVRSLIINQIAEWRGVHPSEVDRYADHADTESFADTASNQSSQSASGTAS